MRRTIRRPWPAGILLLLLVLAVHATPAHAALTRYVKATGTSTGPGVCSITIESFGLVTGSGLQTSSALVFNTNVPIPAASTPQNTALLIRNALDADLPADYAVIVPAGAPDRVQIHRTTGTFTLSVVEDVPTQLIEPYDVPVPFLGGTASLLLAGALMAAGAWLGRRKLQTPGRP